MVVVGVLDVNCSRIQNYVLDILDKINNEFSFKAIYLGILTETDVGKYKMLNDEHHSDI